MKFWTFRVCSNAWERVAVAMLLLSSMGCALAAGNETWEFVDGDGVVHIGNAAPPAQRGVIWLNKVPLANSAVSRGKEIAKPLNKLAGFEQVKPHLENAALSVALDPALVMAVAAAESAFNVDAISHKGALGLMQIMPATAARYGVGAGAYGDGSHAVMEPKVNAQVGSRYLADLLRMFDGDTELAVAAYNAGEGAVIKHGRRIPPYPETQRYVEKVMRLYRAWAAGTS